MARGEDRRRRRRGRCGLPVRDHERVQAVRLRAGVSGDRPRRARERLGVNARACRSTRWRPSSAAPTAARTRWSTPARSRRRASCPAARPRREWQLIRRDWRASPAGADAQRRDLRVGVDDEPSQPQHRPPAAELRAAPLRPGGGSRPLHAPVRARASRAQDLAMMGATLADGGVNPRHRRARRRRRGLPAHARRHDDRRPVRDFRATGSTRSACPARAASAAASSPCAGQGRARTFAPPLDGAGNSVKGQLVAAFLSRRLGLDLFVSGTGVAARRGRKESRGPLRLRDDAAPREVPRRRLPRRDLRLVVEAPRASQQTPGR